MVTLKNGDTHMKTYIEERGAVVGKFVEVLDEEFASIEGKWEVISAADKPIAASALLEIQKSERNHRKATDI